jgi:predicted nucleic acid-binding protein
MTTDPALPPALLDWSAYVRVALAQMRPERGRRLGKAALDDFKDAVRADRLYVSPPFRLEARYSALTAAQFDVLSEYLDDFRAAHGDADTWPLAEKAQRELADNPSLSHRVAPNDLLLAAIASQHGLGILHYDSDFDLLAKHTTLDFESVWIAPAGSVD